MLNFNGYTDITSDTEPSDTKALKPNSPDLHGGTNFTQRHRKMTGLTCFKAATSSADFDFEDISGLAHRTRDLMSDYQQHQMN